MKLEVTKIIEYTFAIEVDPDDYNDYREDGDYSHLDSYVVDKDPAFDFKHDVHDFTVFDPEDI